MLCLLLASCWFIFGIFFDPEKGSSAALGNFGKKFFRVDSVTSQKIVLISVTALKISKL
jgi:hypothetical protein